MEHCLNDAPLPVNGGRAWAQRRMFGVLVSSLVIVAVEDSSNTKVEAHAVDKKTN